MKIKNYDILDKLGHSGVATLYQAKQVNPKLDVVLAIITSDNILDDEERNLLPLQNTDLLKHSNIAATYASGMTEDGDFYLVSEYFTGGSLQDKIESGALPIEKVLSVLENIAPALDYAHSQGVYHHNIRPQNVLFRGPDEAVLSTFNLSAFQQKVAERTCTNKIQEALEYMCPEQAEGKSLNAQSDLYQLGLTFYEMLTGEKAVEVKTSVQAIYQHAIAPAPELPKKHTNLQPVLDTLLAKKPSKRYSTAKIFLTSLKVAIRDTDKQMASTSTTPTTRQNSSPSIANTNPPSNTDRPKLSINQADGVKGNYHLEYADIPLKQTGDLAPFSRNSLAAAFLIASFGGLYMFNSSDVEQITEKPQSISAIQTTQHKQGSETHNNTNPTEIMKVTVKTLSKKTNAPVKASYYIEMENGEKLGKKLINQKQASFDLFPGKYTVFSEYKEHTISKQITVSDRPIEVLLHLDIQNKKSTKNIAEKTTQITIKTISGKNKNPIKSSFSIQLANGEKLGGTVNNKKQSIYDLFPGKYEVLVRYKDYPPITKKITVKDKPQNITIEFNLENLSNNVDKDSLKKAVKKADNSSKKIKLTVKAISRKDNLPLKATYFILSKTGAQIGEKLTYAETGDFELAPGEYDVFAQYKEFPLKGRTISVSNDITTKEILFTLGAL